MLGSALISSFTTALTLEELLGCLDYHLFHRGPARSCPVVGMAGGGGRFVVPAHDYIPTFGAHPRALWHCAGKTAVALPLCRRDERSHGEG